MLSLINSIPLCLQECLPNIGRAYRHKYYLLFPLLFITNYSYGQIDTTVTIPTIEINATALRSQALGGRMEKWSSEVLQNNAGASIADLLGKESNVFVKSYGLGSIATTSIRGASAGHTVVVWNGLTLQSPMLGLLDLSMLPSGLMDEVGIQYGGQSTLWGSGAIGGVIHLNNQAKFGAKFGIDIQSSFGSFGTFNQQLILKKSNRKWSSTTRLFNQEATNDFKYSIRADLPKRTQTHAKVKQQGLLQELAYQVKENQLFTLHFWTQKADREIPPTTTQNKSEAVQVDDFIRTSLQWKKTGDLHTIKAKTAYFSEQIDYQDLAINLRALSNFKTLIGEVEGIWTYNSSTVLHWGINDTYTTAKADSYSSNRSENRAALFAAWQYELGQWKAQFNIRQELVDANLVPLMPSLGIEGKLESHLLVKAKISRNYRLPTLNDRFWEPGGSADLQAEKGWSEELGLHTFGDKNNHAWSYSVTGFNRLIDNWILWSIAEGNSFWSANNITKVWSRGVEQRVRYAFTRKDWSLDINGGYDYIRSTNQIALESPRIPAGDQLIYVPTHQGFLKTKISYRKLQAVYQHTFTGASQGISDALPSYQLGYLRFQFQQSFQKWNASIFLQTNNIWNTNYRVIERRAMPGRYFQLGINLKVFKKSEVRSF